MTLGRLATLSVVPLALLTMAATQDPVRASGSGAGSGIDPDIAGLA